MTINNTIKKKTQSKIKKNHTKGILENTPKINILNTSQIKI